MNNNNNNILHALLFSSILPLISNSYHSRWFNCPDTNTAAFLDNEGGCLFNCAAYSHALLGPCPITGAASQVSEICSRCGQLTKCLASAQEVLPVICIII
jgi:hypothetical protein